MRFRCFLLCVCLCVSATGCADRVDTNTTDGIVLIDPGHGGFDGGAVAADGTTEKHINLAISLYLRDLLYICGVPVEMTRSTDSGLEADTEDSIREKKVADMRKRLEMYQSASLVIAVHQNKFTQSQYYGTQLFYSTGHPDGSILASCMRESVVQLLQPQNKRETKAATDGIYLLYHTDRPAVLVECGFISNPEERDKLKTPVYQQQLAFALMAGYWNYKQK